MLGAYDPMAFVATARPQDARRFYSEILGLRLVADDDFALVYDLNGTTLRVQKVREHAPAAHTVLGWKVADIAATVAALAARGVRFQRYDVLEQDAAGIWTAPGGAQVAWFKDPDGNTLSLTQI